MAQRREEGAHHNRVNPHIIPDRVSASLQVVQMNAGVTAFQGAVSSRKQRDRWHSAERKVVQMRAGVSAFQVRPSF